MRLLVLTGLLFGAGGCVPYGYPDYYGGPPYYAGTYFYGAHPIPYGGYCGIYGRHVHPYALGSNWAPYYNWDRGYRGYVYRGPTNYRGPPPRGGYGYSGSHSATAPARPGPNAAPHGGSAAPSRH